MLINNRYQLGSLLGVGGMGKVYHALDRLTQTTVALKRVELPSYYTPAAVENDELTIALAREFRTLASLHHPHIISVLDYGFDNGSPYFTMEYLASARPLDAKFAPYPLPEKINYLIQLLQALAYLHRHGVIHRDLKPTNVLVAGQTIRVLDFGLALEHSQIEPTQQLMGTLLYMAPELFEDSSPSVASDLYAFGILACEVLQGYAPFNIENFASLLSVVLSETPNLSGLPPAVVPVITCLLSKKPSERYASAEVALIALCHALGLPQPAESMVLRDSYLQFAKFVGRKNELDTLRATLQTLQQGQGGLWLVGGESGVGKSRLVEEIRIRAQVMGIITLRGQAVAEAGLPYQFWREPLRRLLLTTPLQPAEASLLQRLIPDIETLLQQKVDPLPPLDPQTEQQKLHYLITHLFHRQTQPTLLILEDLQWAQESLQILRHLAVGVEKFPLLIIGTYRDEEAPDLPHQFPAAHRLKLHRLNRQGIEALSQAMLGKAGLAPKVVNFLEHETEGNTFFIVEVIRTLAEGVDNLSSIGWMTLPKSVVAGGVQKVIQKRLARVPQDAVSQMLLKVAAVAGRELDLSLLALEVDELLVQQWLTICSNIALLERSEKGWRFSHDKFREAILAQLSPAERQDLHAQVAQALEQLYPNDPAQTVLLMEHWFLAKQYHRTLPYSLVACRQWVYTSQYPPVHLWAERLLPFAQGEQMIQLLNANGLAYFFEGYTTQALAYFQKSVALLQDKSPNTLYVDALNGLALALLYSGLAPEADQYIQQALHLARTLAYPLGTGWALLIIGEQQNMRGNFQQGMALFEEALTIGQTLPNQPMVAYALLYMGGSYGRQGQGALAISYLHQALAAAQNCGDLRIALLCLRELGNFYLHVAQDFAQAKKMFEEAYTFCQKIGGFRDEIFILLYWVQPLILEGNFPQAYKLLYRIYVIAQDILGWEEHQAGFLTRLALLKVKQEQFEQAAAYLGLGLELSLDVSKERYRQTIEQPTLALSPEALTQANLPPQQFALAFEHGRTLDFEEILLEFLAQSP